MHGLCTVYARSMHGHTNIKYIQNALKFTSIDEAALSLYSSNSDSYTELTFHLARLETEHCVLPFQLVSPTIILTPIKLISRLTQAHINHFSSFETSNL